MKHDSPPARRRPARKRGRPEGAGVAAVTRNNIMRAAVYCFAQSGYAQTSNHDIAQAAGITSGSLYHHFDSKAAIYQEALVRVTNAPDEDLAGVHYEIGVLLGHTPDRVPEALAALELAASLNPQHEPTRLELATIAEKRGAWWASA